ncbi:ABC transporter permease [Paenactinomyces guangxiensis]|uniref:Sugar ABC transporter permease n=1 Tax=Paenactinomyces guangxiensis TaxID=1490290 RepID=A0A7W1WUV7_9BACL|nr:ABC transporter permease subunit [Paenactinomyces guangxiensis]MBA4496480.1 sugar ABC transporter permease [Paenactinomyces guangxiensis]MBH8593594.1 sugar ABC transporter permease [Paenactinomyces guangxiensis]
MANHTATDTGTDLLTRKQTKVSRLGRKVYRYRWYYLMMLPGLLYFLIYHYLPMAGVVIAFKDFNLSDGIFYSPWVGLKHFEEIFTTPDIYRTIRNTLIISLYRIIFGMLPDLLLAIILNEIRVRWFKRTVQTITYGPYFLSWVIVYALTFSFLAPESGLVNTLLRSMGYDPIDFLTNQEYFRTILVASDVWKSTGFGAVIYLASLATINPQLYEAAVVDGAGRWRQLWHITLPGIRNVFILLLILRIGHIMDAGFDQVYIFLNARVYETGDIIDTWVFRRGLENLEFSLATAVGFFKGVVGLVLVIGANKLAKRFGGSGIW